MWTSLRLIVITLMVLFFLSQCQQQELKVNQKEVHEETHVASILQSPLDNRDGFWVIAHRGVSGSYPENTLSAFQAAIDIRAEMVELDISTSKDGIPVTVHDRTVDRTTDFEGDVQSFSLEELKRMEVGAWFSEEFRGEEFPTLKNSLELMKDKIAVNIEIKTEAVSDETEGGVVDKALQVVKDLDMTSSVIFSSFDYRVMEQLNVLDPKMAKALLYEASQSAELLPSELVQKYKVDIFNCSYKQLSEEWINDLQKHKIPYFVYTVNEPELMRELIEKGVSGIFTDFPQELIRIVENM
ncbi:MAG: glycerophosphodiester phosphodiesterase family protein [Bacteroidota bacterium]|nr:glycerophosphodiester phosphodiesterase family protein [Bacteroidota bacterium]